ncbi:MAG: site-specific integrase [Clostridiales bacterium]|nr:site-specific integrase [Clostridiales bacterium]
MANKKKPKNHYGEGSIFYSNVKKKWMAQINVGKDGNGKLIRKTVVAGTREEAEKKLSDLKLSIYTGKFVNANTITFSQLSKQIYDEKLAMNEIQPQTYFRTMETLKLCKEINDVPVQKIDSTLIKQMLLSRVNYSNSTIRKIYILLNQCFNEAMKRKIISDNPMLDVRRPKSSQKQKKIRALTLDEQKRFLEVLRTEKVKYAEQMYISMFTGMRMGEINALSINDLNLNFGFINIDKTISRGEHGRAFINDSAKTDKGNRQIPINSTVRPVIESIVENYKATEDNALFHTSVGTLIATSVVNTEFRRIVNKYNIQDKSVKGTISLHSLRHTYATRCIESGMPPKVLQNLMGHTDIKVTLDTYADVFDNFQSVSIEQSDSYLNQVGLAV